MTELLADQVLQKIKQARKQYHQLILIIAPTGTGKTNVLQDVMKRIDSSLINVNLELSRRMLDLTERERALHAPQLLGDISDIVPDNIVLFDNIEILFDVALQLDPLRLLQGLSRNKVVVAVWNGTIQGNHITYAVPEHPEYRRYKAHDFLVVSPEAIQ